MGMQTYMSMQSTFDPLSGVSLGTDRFSATKAMSVLLAELEVLFSVVFR